MSSQRNKAAMLRLVEHRERAGVTSLQVAAKMETAYPYLRLAERGLINITDKFLVRYRVALARCGVAHG